jgi:transaldolase
MDFKIRMFADGADLEEIKRFALNPLVAGFTTNPTLMRKAGIEDYIGFSRQAVEIVFPKPISFEVFSDDLKEMAEQARSISAWGTNVYVKIPITNTAGIPTNGIVSQLSSEGVKLNVTALTTIAQVEGVIKALTASVPTVVSVFAGRIADTGLDPIPLMTEAKRVISSNRDTELLWASPREVLNLVQAEQINCDIITMTSDLWKKIPGLGKDLSQLSLETVKMFFDDAVASKYSIK